MSKILEATCLAGVVSYDGFPVVADILSKGIGASEGVLILEGEAAKYLTSNATDLETTMAKVVDALTKITETLTAIGAGMTGATTAPPPSLATNVALINGYAAQITALKETLK